MQKVIECVPNFSEGRDLEVIRQITAAIESVDTISLLNVDPGAAVRIADGGWRIADRRIAD